MPVPACNETGPFTPYNCNANMSPAVKGCINVTLYSFEDVEEVLIEFVIGVPFNVILDDIGNPEVILIS